MYLVPLRTLHDALGFNRNRILGHFPFFEIVRPLVPLRVSPGNKTVKTIPTDNIVLSGYSLVENVSFVICCL